MARFAARSATGPDHRVADRAEPGTCRRSSARTAAVGRRGLPAPATRGCSRATSVRSRRVKSDPPVPAVRRPMCLALFLPCIVSVPPTPAPRRLAGPRRRRDPQALDRAGRRHRRASRCSARAGPKPTAATTASSTPPASRCRSSSRFTTPSAIRSSPSARPTRSSASSSTSATRRPSRAAEEVIADPASAPARRRRPGCRSTVSCSQTIQRPEGDNPKTVAGHGEADRRQQGASTVPATSAASPTATTRSAPPTTTSASTAAGSASPRPATTSSAPPPTRRRSPSSTARNWSTGPAGTPPSAASAARSTPRWS